MGGNALKSIKTMRIDKPTFDRLSIELTTAIKKDISMGSSIPLSYADKTDFGDIDVLIKDNGNNNIRTYIEERFKPREMYCNNDVISFDYENVQIDFIIVPKEKWEMGKTYFSFNDLGNLMGRIAGSMGFSYGFHGLSYKYYYKNNKKTIILSRDPKEIFEFLGFDYNRYLDGFETLNDVFDYVINSKYFNPKVFCYDELNHQNRTRNKKRKTYRQFLEHIEHMDDIKKESKVKHLVRAIHYFIKNVNIPREILSFRKTVNAKIKSKEKFNGNYVMKKYPELSKDKVMMGKLMGSFISFISKSTNMEFSKYLLIVKRNEVRKQFDLYYELHKFNNTQSN